jgi:peptidylprolyl isomerase
MKGKLDKTSATYWVIFLVVALYSGISVTSFAKIVEEEQDAIIRNLQSIYVRQGQSQTEEKSIMKIATLKTTKGDIKIELFEDKMPITVGNFVKLAENDFYDGVKFHRVIDGFMIQSGDPNSKGNNTNIYGAGGPGYTIQDEFVAGLSNIRGTISMANTGAPNSGGSQFFINLVDNTWLDFDKQPLTSRHPVFGRVTNGMDVIESIGKTKTGAQNIPTESVVITNVIISSK